MNRLLILTGLFLVLVGCAKQPVIANLNPVFGEQPEGIYHGVSVAITGQDLRKSSEVVVYMNDQPATRLANVTAPKDLIAKKLAGGLREQGLVIEPTSQVQLKFVVNDLLARVTHDKLLYSAVAKTHIILTVENQGSVFTKVFKREANNDSATRPDLPELEAMLNAQLTDIAQQIFQDEEIRRLLSKK
jgi:uncharacterized lipoprotein